MSHGHAGLGESTPGSVFYDEGRFGRLFGSPLALVVKSGPGAAGQGSDRPWPFRRPVVPGGHGP